MSRFVIKLIAVFSMLFDHFFRLFGDDLIVQPLLTLQLSLADSIPWLAASIGGLLAILPYLGRIAAPIFIFCIADGYIHTRSVSTYGIRIGLFALISQVPYAFFFNAYINTPLKDCQPNFLFTLLFGLLSIWGWEHPFAPSAKMNQKIRDLHGLPLLGWRFFSAVLLLMPARIMQSEGGFFYAALVLVFYLTRNWGTSSKSEHLPHVLTGRSGKVCKLVLFFGCFSFIWLPVILQYLANPSAMAFQDIAVNAWGPCLGVLITLGYNGKKGLSRPASRYLIYVFYPVHLFVLGVIKLYLK